MSVHYAPVVWCEADHARKVGKVMDGKTAMAEMVIYHGICFDGVRVPMWADLEH